MFIGIVLGGVGAKLGGTRRMFVLAPLMGLAAGLGAFTAYDWWWAALLAATAAIAGAGIGFGWFAPLLMVPYAATFVTPLSSARHAVTYGVVVAIGTLYGVVIMRRFGAPEVVEGERRPLPHAAACGAPVRRLPWVAPRPSALRWDGPSRTGFRSRSSSWFSTSSSGSETGYGERRSVQHSGLPPRYPWRSSIRLHGSSRRSQSSRSFSRSRRPERTGSCTGCTRSRSCSFLAAPGQVGFEAEERGLQILVGIGLLVVGLFIFHALGTWLSKRHPQPEFASAG